MQLLVLDSSEITWKPSPCTPNQLSIIKKASISLVFLDLLQPSSSCQTQTLLVTLWGENFLSWTLKMSADMEVGGVADCCSLSALQRFGELERTTIFCWSPPQHV